MAVTNDYIFLYGTLLPELAAGNLRPLLARLEPVGRGSVPGRLYDLGDYPGAVFDESAPSSVHGRVFVLAGRDALREFDAYEGYDERDDSESLYRRVRQMVTLEDGNKLTCWMYAYNRDPRSAPVVPGGDYLVRRSLSPSPGPG